MTSLLQRGPVYFLIIAAVYLALLLPTISRQGISWDEQTDLEIARAYLAPGGWLVGSQLDLSQMRLPHASVALVYALTGRDDLITARVVSVLVGLLALMGVYHLGLRIAGPGAALLATLLLALSPFYLSFARVAFTETDIYLACLLVYLLLALDHFRSNPSLGWAAAVGLLFGLCLSAKFTALALIPAVAVGLFLATCRPRSATAPPEASGRAAVIGAAAGALALAGLALSRMVFSAETAAEDRLPVLLLILAGWLACLAVTAWQRRRTISPLAAVVLVFGLAALTFLVTPPEHLTNPNVLRSLAWRYENEMRFRSAFVLEAAGLHLASILFKSSPLVGLGLFTGWLLSLVQWRRPALLAPLLASLGYFGGLLLLPLAQTFYVIPILPVLAIFTAERFACLAARWRWAAVALGGSAALLLAADLIACFPDYNLNGYQYLGSRVIFGRSSVGYRSVVQTPSDGVEQVFRWLNDNAGPGDLVISYALEDHIVRAAAPDPRYRIISGFNQPGEPRGDYVVTEVNTDYPQSWWTRVTGGLAYSPPYDPAWLAVHYTRAFSVMRAFGIEMASVWKRK